MDGGWRLAGDVITFQAQMRIFLIYFFVNVFFAPEGGKDGGLGGGGAKTWMEMVGTGKGRAGRGGGG